MEGGGEWATSTQLLDSARGSFVGRRSFALLLSSCQPLCLSPVYCTSSIRGTGLFDFSLLASISFPHTPLATQVVWKGELVAIPLSRLPAERLCLSD